MNENSGYSVLNCTCMANGIRTANDRFAWGPGMRDAYSIQYVTKGKGTVTVDEGSFEVSAGQSFIVFPFSTISIEADLNDPWEYWWVEFKGLEVAWLVGQTSFSKRNPVVPKIHVKNFEKYFDVIYGANESVYEQCRTNARMFLLLSYYVEHFPRNTAESNNYVAGARDYVDKNYRNTDCTVANVSKAIKIDRTYLFRLFKEETGTSVLHYINKKRIDKAAIMLIDKNISIKDVSFSVGFTDQMYFSKVFKKIKGITPSDYRREHSTSKLFDEHY